jgi:hypothetical protein
MNNKTRGISEKDKTLAVLWPDDEREKVAWDVAFAPSELDCYPKDSQLCTVMAWNEAWHVEGCKVDIRRQMNRPS